MLTQLKFEEHTKGVLKRRKFVSDLVLIHSQITVENIVMVMIFRLTAAFWNHAEVSKLF
jgi:hypothetical protein